MTQITQIEPLLTQEELAEILHCHVGQVSMLREVGILPAIKTGRNYMFTKQTYDEFIKNYTGQDVSNKMRALEAKRTVTNHLMEM